MTDETWKLVPVEPTAEMLHAMPDLTCGINCERYGGETKEGGYESMLSAAPVNTDMVVVRREDLERAYQTACEAFDHIPSGPAWDRLRKALTQ